MTLRFRLALAMGLVVLAGCSDSMNSGPMSYSISSELATLQQEKLDSDGKPVVGPDKKNVMQPKLQLQKRVESSLAEVFGSDPQKMIVPKGSGLPEGGARLADQVILAGKESDGPKPVGFPVLGSDGKPTNRNVVLEGGFSLYRKHCLHCHGVSGDGKGPTAAFLWPRPRDYRKGLYKFTSTASLTKPTRDDLKRVLLHGIANSSMPSFEALMTPGQIEQVIDYVIFLSVRGETEHLLVVEADGVDEPKDADEKSDINAAKALEIAGTVFTAWSEADSKVLNPPIPRTPSTPASIRNGKNLFLGLGDLDPKAEKGKGLACVGCHGPKAQGNGLNFVSEAMFREVVFGGDPALQDKRLEEFLEAEGERAVEEAEPTLEKIKSPGEREEQASKIKETRIAAVRDVWVKASLDEWLNPLRPANINNGMATMYKGGRRPLDLYWRIAKGINGAKMPPHDLEPKQIWDLVNFVLALPTQPSLLDDGPDLVAAFAAASAKAAGTPAQPSK